MTKLCKELLRTIPNSTFFFRQGFPLKKIMPQVWKSSRESAIRGRCCSGDQEGLYCNDCGLGRSQMGAKRPQNHPPAWRSDGTLQSLLCAPTRKDEKGRQSDGAPARVDFEQFSNATRAQNRTHFRRALSSSAAVWGATGCHFSQPTRLHFLQTTQIHIQVLFLFALMHRLNWQITTVESIIWFYRGVCLAGHIFRVNLSY